MKKELQDKLFQEYPAIFKQKDLSMKETAMCWGIACGDGWYELIDELCGEIQNRVDNVNRRIQNGMKNNPVRLIPTKSEKFICEAVQVKEKFGGLCFYVYGGDDYTDGVISFAETMSYKICSECGEKSTTNPVNRGWIYTLCSQCRDKKSNEEEKRLDTINSI